VLATLFFAFLLLLCVLYYKERMLSWDPAFFSFDMIQAHGFSIPLERWSNVITEFIPWLFLKAGCSLGTFLIVYSISPILIAWAVFGVITLGLKQYKAGIAMLLGLCLTFRLTFYYNITELFHVLVFVFLLWALLTREGPARLRDQVISALLIVVVSYYHQLSVFPVMFVLLYELIAKKGTARKPLYRLLAFSAAWYAVRIFLLTHSDYENNKIPSLQVIMEQLPNLFHLPSTVHLKEFMRYQAWPWFFVLLAALALAVWRKQYLSALLTIAFSFGFTALILITYYKGESTLAYEQYYTVLGFFPAVFLLDACWNRVRPAWILVLVAPVLLRCTKSIYSAHFIISERVAYIGRLVENGRTMPEKKYLVNAATFNRNVTDATWALAYETLLYSALPGPDSSVTVYAVEGDDRQYDSIMHDPNLFMGSPGAFGQFYISGLNRNYFNLPGTTGYKKTTTFASSPDSLPDPGKITLTPALDTMYNHALTYVIAPVDIVNRTGDTLHALPVGDKGWEIGYRITYPEGKGGEVKTFSPTPLEQDVIHHYRQGVTVYHDLQKGEYRVQFILERKGVRVEATRPLVLIVR
jgi:hypothetical protein